MFFKAFFFWKSCSSHIANRNGPCGLFTGDVMHSFAACGRRANEFMFAGTVHLLLGPGAELAGNGTRKDGELSSI